MKNLLHITGTLNRGGIEILLLDVARNRSFFTNYCLHIISSKGGALEKDFEKTLSEYKLIKRRFKIDLQFIYQLRKYIIKKNISVIHVHEQVIALHIIIATLFLPTKKVFSAHGFLKFNGFLFRFILYKFDKIIFVSKALKEYAVRQTKEEKHLIKMQVVYNGLDILKFGAEQSSFKEELNIEEQDILLGMIGNFTKWKDPETICKALPIVMKENPNVYFAFVGLINDINKYNNCSVLCKNGGIEKRVFFLGSRQEIPFVLSGFNIFVYSSNSDTFGISVVEAMLAGIPVVVNDLDVFKEITNNGEFAFLYETKDDKKLAYLLNHILMYPEDYLKKAINARKYAIENFGIKKHIENLQLVYNSI